LKGKKKKRRRTPKTVRKLSKKGKLLHVLGDHSNSKIFRVSHSKWKQIMLKKERERKRALSESKQIQEKIGIFFPNININAEI
jgi:hypothetical protein